MGRQCTKCSCPLTLLEGERRRLCERCRCSSMSRVEKQRRANRLSYVANREARLAQRRERRAREGEALRAAERARYAAKRGGEVRAYRQQPREEPWETPSTS